ncbi:MAG TPA: TIGR02757 family protein [Chitinophagaceae bacterium]|jgi:uncharacterized protein (TIGR02757 family)|nr:TIGR02757 family protein [Chitinophagaceae bacterium]
MNKTALQDFLNCKVELYNNAAFVEDDPVRVPHQFTLLQDIEIAGFFTAILSWGRRSTIIDNSKKLMSLMDNAPYAFIKNHRQSDLKPFLSFAHRTFNATDLLYFISFLQEYYTTFLSLESAFSTHLDPEDKNTKKALIGFQQIAFAGEHPARTRKHLSSPAKNSACKRLNMFLRWMVRHDHQGVDFGLWKNISPSQLVIPMDVHVSRVARRLDLIEDEKVTWKNAEALTGELRKFDPEDPVKYDFALFGLGVMEKFV